MSELGEDQESPEIEWIAREARRPVAVDPLGRARVMAAVRAEPLPSRGGRLGGTRWFQSPLAGLAVAAGLVGIAVFAGHKLSESSRANQPIGQHIAVAPSMPAHPVSDSGPKVQLFRFHAPEAKQVAVVGDFNQWNVAATPMVRSNGNGEWTAAVPLTAGAHSYSFVVVQDGDEQWHTDPNASLATDDGFGRSNSVVLVGP